MRCEELLNIQICDVFEKKIIKKYLHSDVILLKIAYEMITNSKKCYSYNSYGLHIALFNFFKNLVPRFISAANSYSGVATASNLTLNYANFTKNIFA